MRIRSLLLVLVLVLAAPLASHAFVPENGHYGTTTPDATAGGTAISVEIQNDYLFAAGYVYNPDGTPTFVTIQGPMKYEFIKFPGSILGYYAWRLNDPTALFSAQGGQCIGTISQCPYKKPTVVPIGGVDIQFTSNNQGTMTWGTPGHVVSVKLTRFQFMGADAADTMLGIWDFVLDRSVSEAATNIPYNIPAERLTITSSTSTAISNFPYGGCVTYDRAWDSCLVVGGVRQLVSGKTIACTSTNASSTCEGWSYGNKHVILVYSENDFKVRRVYTFYDHGLKFTGPITGTAAVCPEGQADYLKCTTKTGIVFEAFRSASGNYATTGVGMH
ncbi:MAG: hypothetical protein JSR65_07905 [Proteobacteria bacterium]|nr:hypothetical protein [Pseudomonadota bacterium]